MPSPRSKQQGSIIPLVAVSLLAMVGITGMVVDTGHVFTNKGRVQNALDASALSAAKVLDETRNQMLARDAAIEIFNQHMAQPGFGELEDLGLQADDLIIQFSDTRNPFIANPAATRFVRLRLNPGVIQLQTIFMKAFGVDALDLAASAVAGPTPALGTVCNVVPSIVCGDPAFNPDENGMYGYNYGDRVVLALGNTHNNEVGPGNFQLLDLGDDEGGVRAGLAGGSEGCVSSLGQVETKPGVNRGPVAQGFNTRFGIYLGPVDSDDFPPDLVTDAGAPNYPDTYAEYKADYNIEEYDEADGVAERRVLAVTFGNCTGTVNGQGTIDVLGFGCIFLNEPAVDNGALKTVQIYGELVRDCKTAGIPGPNPVDGPGAHTIQLYGDPDRWDS